MLSIVTHCADNKNFVPAVFQDEKSAYFYMKYRAAIDIRDSHKIDNPKCCIVYRRRCLKICK